jgi:hypothetical protein
LQHHIVCCPTNITGIDDVIDDDFKSFGLTGAFVAVGAAQVLTLFTISVVSKFIAVLKIESMSYMWLIRLES